MISPLDNFTNEELKDEEIYHERPEWIKWRYAAWSESVAKMTDDQRGWYIELLNRAAMSGYPEEGYLPEDETELKGIAGFEELDKSTVLYLSRGIQIPPELIEKVKRDREKGWLQVRRKFVSSKKHLGYIYNRPLLHSIQQAISKTNIRKRYGRLGGLQRQANLKQEKELKATPEVIVQDLPQDKPQASVQENNNFLDLSNNTFNLQESIQETEQEQANTKKKATKEKKDWIPENFELTHEQKMKILKLIIDWLELNINEAQRLMNFWFNEFIDYWNEIKKADIKRHRSDGKYSNWYMTFRRRVETKCSQEERRRIGGKSNGNIQSRESAAERNARLEHEANARVRQLRGGGSGNDKVNPQGLPLN